VWACGWKKLPLLMPTPPCVYVRSSLRAKALPCRTCKCPATIGVQKRTGPQAAPPSQSHPTHTSPLLPPVQKGTNAIHGMQNTNCLPNGQCPTSFPAPNALSATFNMSLVNDMGRIIGRELRAYCMRDGFPPPSNLAFPRPLLLAPCACS
jgi:beta-glucosidase-like glycosyl hydrolase